MRLTEEENDRLLNTVQMVMDQGKFATLSELGMKAGLGRTSLYPIMKRTNKISRKSAEKLERYFSRTNGNGKASNGHTMNGSSAATSPQLELFQMVLEKLVEVKAKATNPALSERVDKLLARWGNEGLELLAGAALSQAV